MAASGIPDAGFMAAALSLGARNLGDCWPNPSVGCVLVKDGVIVGRGWTAAGGRPHAETVALQQAGDGARGATAYVTLEPCSHHGRTPPCADALIAAGVVRVVAAVGDPDPRVSGKGFAKLRAAGITVDEGVGAAEANRLAAGFFLRIRKKRPLFALKTATSLDGRTALASGKSQWITGPVARHAVHVLRARFDAIMVGSGTALADDPMLTCRLDGYAGRPKVRVVLDRRLRLSPNSQLVATAAQIPTWVVTSDGSQAAGQAAALEDMGVEVISIRAGLSDHEFAARTGLALAERGLTRVMIEGGAAIAAAFLKADMTDEIAWFRSAALIGGDGRAAVESMGTTEIDRLPRYRLRETLAFGPDRVDFLEHEDV